MKRNQIDKALEDKQAIKIMTHVVAGYPDMAASKEIIMAMDESGADLIEIQIPFSDPLADGPTIMRANQASLENGTTAEDCFRAVGELHGLTRAPLLFMTYCNIPFTLGMESFVRESANCGVSGLIIPDLPFDEATEGYHETARSYGLHPIPVVSPDVSMTRLIDICARSTGFIYTTLKVGITGAGTAIDPQGLAYIKRVKQKTVLPIAAGFGISSPLQVKQLAGIADAAVIGSHMINLFNQSGLAAVTKFLRMCKEE